MKKSDVTPVQMATLIDLKQLGTKAINPSWGPLQVLLEKGLVLKVKESRLGYPRYKLSEEGEKFLATPLK
jgi:hypothetical protein